MTEIEIKDFNWLKENINLYFSNNIDERFPWCFSYNRLQECEKDKIFKLIQKFKKSA